MTVSTQLGIPLSPRSVSLYTYVLGNASGIPSEPVDNLARAAAIDHPRHVVFEIFANEGEVLFSPQWTKEVPRSCGTGLCSVVLSVFTISKCTCTYWGSSGVTCDVVLGDVLECRGNIAIDYEGIDKLVESRFGLHFTGRRAHPLAGRRSRKRGSALRRGESRQRGDK